MGKIKRKIELFLILALSLSFKAYAGIGEWNSYGVLSEVNGAIRHDLGVYFSTSCGLVKKDGDEWSVIDIDDGLLTNNSKLLTFDFNDRLWSVSKYGETSILNLKSSSVETRNDFSSESEFNAKKLYSSDKFVYLLAKNQLARYKYNKDYDQYDIIDYNQMLLNGKAIVSFKGKIYLADDNSIYSISEDQNNISDIGLWQQASFNPELDIVDMYNFNEKLYLLTSSRTEEATSPSGVYALIAGSLVYQPQFGNLDIKYSYLDGNTLYFTYVKKDEPDWLYYGFIEGSSDQITVISRFWKDSIDNYFFCYYGEELSLYLFYQKYFQTLDVPSQEFSQVKLPVLPLDGIKFSHFDKSNQIISFLSSRNEYNQSFLGFYDILNSLCIDTKIKVNNSQITSMTKDPKNKYYYFGTWGQGVYKYELDENGLNLLQNYKLGAIQENSDYNINASVTFDRQNNLWSPIFLVKASLSDSALVKFDEKNNTIKKYPLKNSLGKSVRMGKNIYLDHQNWLWVGGASEINTQTDGLAVLDIHSPEKVGIINDPGMGGVLCFAITNDHKKVWLGTARGLFYLDLELNNIQKPHQLNNSLLRSDLNTIGTSILSLKINNLGEVWVGTDKGLTIIDENKGTYKHIVPKKSSGYNGNVTGSILKGSLAGDLVLDINFDETAGLAYLTTEAGLSIYDYSGVKNNEKSSEISLEPSPFLVDGHSLAKFVIKDAARYTHAKIYNLRGQLVRGGSKKLILTEGFDGRDDDGKILSSGVYQIIVYNDDDKNILKTGKIAIIKK